MQFKNFEFNKKHVQSVEIPLQNAVLVMLITKKGYIICGYLNIQTAEKLGDAACVITGIKNTEELLSGRVVNLTSKARKLGIKPGMSGRQALLKLL
jgi:uncharacterized protein YunC (DUF1805 family)